MNKQSLLPKRVYQIAGIYGLLVMTPMYFMEKQIAIDAPPAITHPEYFYGFIGVTLAWQILFLILAKDPQKYRVFIIPTILEKFLFVPAVAILYGQGRVPPLSLLFGGIDLVLGILFCTAYLMTKEKIK